MAKRKPKPRRKLCVSIPPELAKLLRAYAGSRDETATAVVVRALKAELDGFYFATRDGSSQKPGSAPCGEHSRTTDAGDGSTPLTTGRPKLLAS